MQEELAGEYASYFEGKSEKELDEIAESFALSEYLPIIFTFDPLRCVFGRIVSSL